MAGINEELKVIMASKNIKQADIVAALELPKSLVSKFFAGTTVINFESVLSIVKYIVPFGFEGIMSRYCLSITKNNQIQCAFEYASNHRQDALLAQLIEKFDGKRAFHDWTQVYRLALQVQVKKIDCDSALDEFREIYGKLSQPELKSKVDVLEAACLYELGHLETMHNFTVKVERRLNALKDGFIKHSLATRVNMLKAYGLLYVENNPEEAIKRGMNVIKSCASPNMIIASAYHIVGQAQLFTDCEACVDNYKKAVALYREIGQDMAAEGIIKNDIPFAMNVSSVPFDEATASEEEIAHKRIVEGRQDEAVEILDRLIALGEDSDYTYFYKSIATGNIQGLFNFYGKLLKQGDNFFLKVAINALENVNIKIN